MRNTREKISKALAVVFCIFGLVACGSRYFIPQNVQSDLPQEKDRAAIFWANGGVFHDGKEAKIFDVALKDKNGKIMSAPNKPLGIQVAPGLYDITYTCGLAPVFVNELNRQYGAWGIDKSYKRYSKRVELEADQVYWLQALRDKTEHQCHTTIVETQMGLIRHASKGNCGPTPVDCNVRVVNTETLSQGRKSTIPKGSILEIAMEEVERYRFHLINPESAQDRVYVLEDGIELNASFCSSNKPAVLSRICGNVNGSWSGEVCRSDEGKNLFRGSITLFGNCDKGTMYRVRVAELD